MSAVQFYKITINGLDDTLFKTAHFVTDDTEEAKTRYGKFSGIPQCTIDLQSCGTFIQAHSWNCLHALYSMCKTNNIPVAGSNIGPIHKNDVSMAKVMSRDPRYACILAVDVKVEQEARDMAKQNGVRIIVAETYADLLAKYSQFQENYNKKKKEEFKQQAIFPCKLRILETDIYHKKNPLLFGVLVESGIVKVGTPLCIPDKNFLDIGKITSIEGDDIGVNCGETGQQVCIKIIARNDAEKRLSYGRHFTQTNELISKITEESINVMEKWFRDEMSDTDYLLMMELKKTLAIV